MDYANPWPSTPCSRIVPIPAGAPPAVQTPYVSPVHLDSPCLPPTQYSPYHPPEGYLPFVYSPLHGAPMISQSQPTSPWVLSPALPSLPQDGETPAIWPPYAESMPSPSPFCTHVSLMVEPGTFPAEPWGTPVPIRLHPQLIYNPYNPCVPILQWDVIHRAEQARALTGRDLYVKPQLNDQATLPGAPKIVIHSDHPYLAVWMERWGPIVIEKQKITMRDILDAIWEYFQQPLTDVEFDQIKAIPNSLASLQMSARQRIEDSYELRAVALRNGFKRVDVLGGHRRFQGLRSVAYANMTWKAFLGLLPGPVPRFT